jgi:hypothetical protein
MKGRLRALPVIILLPVLLIPFINHFITIGALFQGALAQHKVWYPHLYFLTYPLLKLLYPCSLGLSLYAILRNTTQVGKALQVLLVSSQTLLVFWAIDRFGILIVSGYGYILLVCAVYRILSPEIKILLLQKAEANLNPLNNYSIFIAYVLICLVIGTEFHPFSNFPMYSSFPNSAYVFFLKNEQDKIVPLHQYFNQAKNTGYLAHIFYSSFKYHRYVNASDYDNPVYLKTAGKEMMHVILKDENTTALDFDSLKLYRRNYYLKSDSIKYQDVLIYEQGIKP